MAHAKRALSEYDQSEQWGMRIRIEMSNAKGSGGGGGGRGGGRGRGRGSGRGDRGGRGRGGRGSAMGGRSAPYPPRGSAPRYIQLLQSFNPYKPDHSKHSNFLMKFGVLRPEGLS